MGYPVSPLGQGDAYLVLHAGRASLASPEGLWKAESRGSVMLHGKGPATCPSLRIQVALRPPPFPNSPKIAACAFKYHFFPPHKMHHFGEKAEAQAPKQVLKLLVLPTH